MNETQRGTATVFSEAGKRFRRVRGYRSIPVLAVHSQKNTNGEENSSSFDLRSLDALHVKEQALPNCSDELCSESDWPDRIV